MKAVPTALLTFFATMAPGAVCAVLGAPQTGKTRSTQAADAQGAFRRRVVFDSYAWRDRLEASRGRRISPWAGSLLTPAELLRNTSALDSDPLALVVGPYRELDEADMGRQFSAVANAVWATSDVDLIAEEIGRYGRYSTELINKVASGGGHVGMRLIAICQSLGRIQKDARRNISHVVAFPQAEPEDARYLRARCGDAFATSVAKLQRGQPPITWRLGA